MKLEGGRHSEAIAYCLTVGAFGWLLSGLWRSAYSHPFLLGGILPWSDASGYYTDALLLLEGYPFSEFSSRRPLFSGFLAFLLKVLGGRLDLSLACLVWLNASLCYLFSKEVERSLGLVAGWVTLALLTLYYLRFTGTALTENLGLGLGLCGLALVWQGVSVGSRTRFLFGLFGFSVAMFARTGAMLVLPVLFVWSGFAFAKDGRFSWRSALKGGAVVALAWCVDVVARSSHGFPGITTATNFGHTLYGLTVGGKGWQQVLLDHPELRMVTDPELGRKIFHYAKAAFLANPFESVLGALKYWKDYFWPDPSSVFGFVGGTFGILRIPAAIVLEGASFLALWKSVRAPKGDLRTSLLLCFWLGIFCSVPFVPPRDTDYMRAYAATIPFTIMTAAWGFQLMANCASGETEILVRAHPGSSLTVRSSPGRWGWHHSEVPWVDFEAGLRTLSYPEVAREFRHFSEGRTIVNTIDLKSLQGVWVFLADGVEWDGNVWAVCGRWGSGPVAQRYGFFEGTGVVRRR